MSEPIKRWYQSRTVWASLLVVLVSALKGAGLIDAAGAELITREGADVAVNLITAVLGLFAMYGRVKASHKIE